MNFFPVDFPLDTRSAPFASADASACRARRERKNGQSHESLVAVNERLRNPVGWMTQILEVQRENNKDDEILTGSVQLAFFLLPWSDPPISEPGLGEDQARAS